MLDPMRLLSSTAIANRTVSVPHHEDSNTCFPRTYTRNFESSPVFYLRIRTLPPPPLILQQTHQHTYRPAAVGSSSFLVQVAARLSPSSSR